MVAATRPRHPGVFILPPPRPVSRGLPRLDVAGFVGFAERGPLHFPVGIEDVDTYHAIFGGRFPLAREAGATEREAMLRHAIASFFANGGRRCYVVRVAGDDAAAARFSVPRLVAVTPGGGARLARIEASSPGRWADRLRLATVLRGTRLPAQVFTVAGDRQLRWATQGAPGAIWPGDLLRLDFTGGERLLFPVTAVERATGASPYAMVSGETPWPELREPPFDSTWQVEHALRLAAGEPEPVPASGWLEVAAGTARLSLTGPEAADLGRDDVLLLDLKAGSTRSTVLFPLTGLQKRDQAASPAAPDVVAVGPAPLVIAQVPAPTLPAASPLGGPIRVERLRFDLLLRDGTRQLPPLAELGFNRGHPRFWGDLTLVTSSDHAVPNPADRPLPPDPEAIGGPVAGLRPGETAAAQAARLFRQMREGIRIDPVRDGVLDPAALAGLLAPVDPVPEGAAPLTYLPLGMPVFASDSDFVGPDVPGSDDLGTFAADLFIDPHLRAVAIGSPAALQSAAFDRYYLQDRGLRGVHSLMFVAEAALIAVPDAAHPGWSNAEPQAAPTPPARDLPDEPEPCPPEWPFASCMRPPRVRDVSPASAPEAGETLITVRGANFVMGETTVTVGGTPATEVVVANSTELRCLTPPGRRGPATVSVTTPGGSSVLERVFAYEASATTPVLPRLDEPAAFRLDTVLLPVHAALTTFCRARGDLVAILSLPRHFTKREAIEWQEALRQELGLPRRGTRFDDTREIADLSFVAVFHPWPLILDDGAPGRRRATPPDGAVCGMIAAREMARGAWIAPANVPLRDVVGLDVNFSDDVWSDLFERGFNLLRPQPHDVRVMSAQTLSDERGLRNLATRRLLILLRKVAFERGMDWVFETNHERFRDGVRVQLEDLLTSLWTRGAFSGAEPKEAFLVTTDASVNTPQSIDQGRFVAEIRVAPASAAEFITVRLTRTSDGSLQLTEG